MEVTCKQIIRQIKSNGSEKKEKQKKNFLSIYEHDANAMLLMRIIDLKEDITKY